MIRFVWRQFRLQALVAFAALAVVAAIVLVHGAPASPSPQAPREGALLNDYGSLQYIATLLLVVPALVGMFWGAPLIARELEAALSAGLDAERNAAPLACREARLGRWRECGRRGLLSGLVTWWSIRWTGSTRPPLLDRRLQRTWLVPLGYGAFAFAVGVVLGLLLAPHGAGHGGHARGVRRVRDSRSLLAIRPHLLAAPSQPRCH